MAEDELRVRVDVETKDAEASLGKLEKKAESTASKIGSFFRDIASTFIGVGLVDVFSQIGSLLSDAGEKAREFKEEMTDLGNAARRAGADSIGAIEGVKELAKDGQVSISTLTQSFETLVEQGKTSNEAFDFTDSAKRLAVYSKQFVDSTIDVEDFTKAIIEGAENTSEDFDPALLKTIESLKAMGLATIDVNEDLTGYDAVLQAGAAASSLYAQGVDEAKKAQAEQNESIIRAGETFNAFFAEAKFQAADFFNYFVDILGLSSEKVDKHTKLVESLNIATKADQDNIAAGLAGKKALNEQENQIIATIQAKTGATREFIDTLGKESKSYADLSNNLATYVGLLERKSGQSVADKQAELVATLASLKGQEQAIISNAQSNINQSTSSSQLNLSGIDRARLESTGTQIKIVEEAIKKLNELKPKPVISKEENDKGNDSLRDSDFLLTELEKKIARNQKAFEAFEESAQGTGDALERANEKLGQLNLRALEDAQLKIDKANKDDLDTKLRDIDIIFKRREEAIQDLADRQKEADEENFNKQIQLTDRLAANRLAKEQAIAKARLDEIKNISDQTNSFIGNINTIRGGGTGALGGIGGLLQQGGGAASAAGATGLGATLGQSGVALGIVGAVGGFFASVFDNTEELKKQEEDRQKVLESQRKALEEQIALANKLLDLEKERQGLVKTQAERQIRINELTIKDPTALAAANKKVFEGLLQERLGAANIQGNLTPQQIADIIVERENKLQSTKTITFSQEANDRRLGATEDVLAAQRKAQSLGLTEVSERIQAFIDQANALQRETQTEAVRIRGDFRDQVARQANAFTSLQSDIALSIKEQENRIGLSDEIIDVLGNIKDINEQSLGVQKEQLNIQLEGQRESSFIDIARGGLFSLGSFLSTTAPELTLPNTLGSVTLGTEAFKTSQDVMADSLSKLVAINTEQRDLLAIIASATANSGSSVAGAAFIQTFLANEIGKIQSRSIN